MLHLAVVHPAHRAKIIPPCFGTALAIGLIRFGDGVIVGGGAAGGGIGRSTTRYKRRGPKPNGTQAGADGTGCW